MRKVRSLQRRIVKAVLESEEKYDLHHVNGNHHDNRIENLALLHPNCHRQTHQGEVEWIVLNM